MSLSKDNNKVKMVKSLKEGNIYIILYIYDSCPEKKKKTQGLSRHPVVFFPSPHGYTLASGVSSLQRKPVKKHVINRFQVIWWFTFPGTSPSFFSNQGFLYRITSSSFLRSSPFSIICLSEHPPLQKTSVY